MRLLPLLCSAAGALPLAAQTLTFAEGSAAALQVVAVPEANPTAAGAVVLQQVQFLPLELAGRTLAQGADPAVARRVVRHGLERIELPDGGRLFRYQRQGGQWFGLLHVAGDGAPRVVLELAAAAGAVADPFADRLAVAADGSRAVVPLAAGGLHVVRLDGGSFASTGRADRFVAAPGSAVLPTSLLTGPTHAFFQTAAGRLFRLPLADAGQPVDVSPPAVPNGEWKDQMALSGDGQWLVCLYGPRDQMLVHRLGLAGLPQALALPPAKWEEPGYLPEGPGEPAMLLNHDGSRLFCIDGQLRDELLLVDTAGALPPLQITESAIFQPYIGAHILPKFTGPALTVAIGDPGQMDWFRAELQPVAGTVVNLTGTGSLQMPFPSGTLDPVQATASGGPLLVAERTALGHQLRRLDPATGQQALLQTDLLAPPEPGSAAAGAPPADLWAPGAAGDRLYRAGTAHAFAQTPAGVQLTAPVQGPLYAATWVHLAGGFGAVAFYLPDGTVLAGPLEAGVRQLAATPAGGVVVVGAPLRYLAPGVFAVLNRPAVPQRWCLSGGGG